ncbi:MAG: hypothetical protein JXK07_04265 [Spirochaetes bacterium]|nr:hypothetical protein [Spirochaetota bacterium]MBN2770927.1 hypothetical protein [Spirochaetota bacterium]
MYKKNSSKRTAIMVLKDFLVILPVSAIIGFAVGTPVTIYLKDPLLTGIVRSVLTALVIGFFATLAFAWLFRTIRKTPLVAFAAEFIIIAAGSYIGASINGINSLFTYLFIIFFAELFGIGFGLYMYKKTVRLNSLLKHKQQKLF